MTIEELIKLLQRAVEVGTASESDLVFIRDYTVSDVAMQAGSYGYVDLGEVLMIPESHDTPGGAYLLGEEGVH